MKREYLEYLGYEKAAHLLRVSVHRRKEGAYRDASRYYQFMIEQVKRLVRKQLRYLAGIPASKINHPLRHRGSIAVCNRQILFLDHLHDESLPFIIYGRDEFLTYLDSEYHTVRDTMVQFFKDVANVYKNEIKQIPFLRDIDDDPEEVNRDISRLAEKAKICRQLSDLSKKLGLSFHSASYYALSRPIVFDRHISF